ncbi:flagellar biosynthesis protein FlhB [Nissabacter sp. SGAir0207]|uniref:flagellar biosynthesis protein FlhB n=1 Tax=Nissabacter sp. SGAir0207 TaxID=2126321 RepID=UPI0010CCF9BE|nr:flagellar biosynthesis protein FlhB [Nissabacter sp. SGAir0207]QCR35772.1 flagellar biosynthesis protein FlhB [Nissabacter sp. SGAir0207]
MAEESDLEKTEAPTPHRVDKAREKGQVPRSRELTSILMLAAGVALLWLAGEPMARRLASMVANGMHFDHGVINDDRQMLRRLSSLLEGAFWAMLPIFGGLVLMALAAPLLLGGFLFSTEALKPNFGRLNPVAGLGRLFSSQVGAELLKAILKALLVGWVTWLFLDHYWPAMLRLMAAPTLPALGDALGMIAGCALLILLGLLPMVGFDVFWQIWSNLKKLRMTKQEIREEHKEQDGDPHIKARIRQQQRAMARRRMMADVPKADVIVTNPTHYAVALQYNDRMSAPKVLAKGAGEVALRIRELGGQHRVPLLEAPPLARALYRHSEIGQQIPATLYAAVAEVLAWVYQLKRWRTHGGLIPKKPVHLPVPDALDFKESTSNG